MNLEDIMLSEISQTHTDKHDIIPFIQVLEQPKTQRHRESRTGAAKGELLFSAYTVSV